jgi:methionyl-tRNA formyltransferase
MNIPPASPKIVFMGSPDFALKSLVTLYDHFDVVAAFTQPDRPAGRGKELKPPAVKMLAQKLDIPIFQPHSLKDPEAVGQLKGLDPDLIVVAAYGQILRQAVLDIPKHGSINVHASLLPRWRGAAPIQAAILHGDTQSGVSIMRMDPGLDTGPVLSQRTITLDAEETAGSLSDKLALLGADLLIETLPGYLAGDIEPAEQDNELSTYAPMLKKSDGELDFENAADFLARQVRAYNPWPGTFIRLDGGMLKVHKASTLQQGKSHPGLKETIEDIPAIGTADGWLLLEKIQPAGKNPMSGADFLRGGRDWNGQIKITKLKEMI